MKLGVIIANSAGSVTELTRGLTGFHFLRLHPLLVGGHHSPRKVPNQVPRISQMRCRAERSEWQETGDGAAKYHEARAFCCSRRNWKKQQQYQTTTLLTTNDWPRLSSAKK